MRTIVIAEAGVNHNGDKELAKEMIAAAKNAGADYVKFQTFIPKNLVAKDAGKAEYQKETTDADETQQEMLEKLALTFADFEELKEYCNTVGIGFLSTPFDFDSIEFLKELDIDFWKIPSGEITNLPYLQQLARTGKPIVLSTGMSNLQEVREAIEVLQNEGVQTEDITLLQCNTEYPTPYEDVNLRAMLTMQEEFGVKVGYSDHTNGIEISLAAVALGATVIEKHFTLSREMEGPDHKASLEPDELEELVASIRHIERAMGSGEKAPSASEKRNVKVVRKSIVAKCEIRKGEVFCEENLTVKRPGNGASPMHWYEILGKEATRDYKEDEMIEEETR